MADINFYAGEGSSIDLLSGSGLGFFGSDGHGDAVLVGYYQDTTFITSADGTVEGAGVDNNKYRNSTGAYDYNGTERPLGHLTNERSTVNVRFTHSTDVAVDNVRALIYDRTNTGSAAIGVTTQIAEIVHVSNVFGAGGSGDQTWVACSGRGPAEVLASTGIYMGNSPGSGGLQHGGEKVGGTAYTGVDQQHDWYLALTASPDSVGSKAEYALYVELEYE